MAKGGDYEREICKLLSKWWTKGERDDVFWRSSNSGGRATIRRKVGKDTSGQYGDLAATDPIGFPFLKVFTVEIKRGYNESTFYNDMMERLPGHAKAQKQWDKFVCQVQRDAVEADSIGWLLITKRDRKNALAFLPLETAKKITMKRGNDHFVARVTLFDGQELAIVCCRLEDFLESADPDKIKYVAGEH